ncbi:hypothetical protein [Thermomonospora cellulosilytica]|uniref:Uncharacterized protein n=1 Tax=Thermomonospora cellulosilytica TaxID=1411118 RepID=A0A7W3RAG6_9ACTN|nr:hypothetical protein [Thermomonospora cellulosilytica]MBA9005295.1 hypothetical protein [Thermomonospora cellulosilytica]
MGSYFALVLIAGPPADADAAVAGWLHDTGWQEADGAPARCTTFEAGPQVLGVAGDPAPTADPALLQEVAAGLSARTGHLAVGIDVEDSDILTLLVAEAGTVRQVVRCGPAVAAPPPVPHPVWGRLLGPGGSLDDLATAWTQPAVYAEEVLDRIAGLCGWHADRLRPGGEAHRPVVAERRVRRAGDEDRSAAGPARFGHVGGDDVVEARAGVPVRPRIIAHSVGGDGAGVTVIAWGPAIEEGLLRPLSAELLVGVPQQPLARTGVSLVPGPPATGHFDAAVPAGYPDQATAIRGVPPDEGIRRWLGTRIEAAVILTAERPGTGDLHLGLLPEGDRDRAVAWTVGVNVLP